MENKKLTYIIFGIAAVIVIAIGIKIGLHGGLFIDKRLVTYKENTDKTSIEVKNNKIIRDKTEQKPIDEILNCDTVIVGAGTGGFSAAVASAREGAKTCLIEETNWLGGMLTTAGVAAIDGRPDTPSGIFREIIQKIENYYASNGQEDELHKCLVSYFCFEPSVGNYVLKQIASKEKNLQIFYNSKVDKVYRQGNKVLGVHFVEGAKSYIANAKVTIDATEYGDLMYLANIQYDLGLDKDSTESLAQHADKCIQPLTYVAILQKQSNAVPIEEPKNYNLENYRCMLKKSASCPDSKSYFDLHRLLNYGLMPNQKLMINIPSHSYGNDFHATSDNLENYSREEILEEAKNYSRGFIYYIQTELGLDDLAIYDEFGTDDKFAKIPYMRESRRLVGVKRLIESDVVKEDGEKRADIIADAIAIGDYPIDLHFCRYGEGDVFQPIAPYQIPYGVTIPKVIDGFMAADKNISVSHIVNGTTRLQPVTMSVGQAVGTAAAMAAQQGIEPRKIDIAELQIKLLNAGSNLFFFTDLPADHYAYPYIGPLAVKGFISGYSDFTFRPNNPVNESDLLKIFRVYLKFKNQGTTLLKNVELTDGSFSKVSRSDMASHMYHLLESSGKIDKNAIAELNFEDVNPDTTTYDKLGQLVAAGMVSNNLKFRPNDNLTRAEAMVLLGRALDILFKEALKNS